MTETPRTISNWAEATFGPAGSNFRVAARVHEEVSEVLRSVSGDGSFDEIGEETTDSMIVLSRLGERIGAELHIASVPALATREPRYELEQTAGHIARYMGGLIYAITTGQIDVRDRTESLWQELTTLLLLAGKQPQESIDAKMAINRRRQWKLDGTGHGYHVATGEEGEAAP